MNKYSYITTPCISLLILFIKDYTLFQGKEGHSLEYDRQIMGMTDELQSTTDEILMSLLYKWNYDHFLVNIP